MPSFWVDPSDVRNGFNLLGTLLIHGVKITFVR